MDKVLKENFSPGFQGKLLLLVTQIIIYLIMLRLFFLYLSLLKRSPCPHSMIIVGWWNSSPWIEATGTLYSVPLILSATFPYKINFPGPPVPPPLRVCSVNPLPLTCPLIHYTPLLCPPLFISLLLSSQAAISNSESPLDARLSAFRLTSGRCLVGLPLLTARRPGAWEIAPIDLCV